MSILEGGIRAKLTPGVFHHSSPSSQYSTGVNECAWLPPQVPLWRRTMMIGWPHASLGEAMGREGLVIFGLHILLYTQKGSKKLAFDRTLRHTHTYSWRHAIIGMIALNHRVAERQAWFKTIHFDDDDIQICHRVAPSCSLNGLTLIFSSGLTRYLRESLIMNHFINQIIMI